MKQVAAVLLGALMLVVGLTGCAGETAGPGAGEAAPESGAQAAPPGDEMSAPDAQATQPDTLDEADEPVEPEEQPVYEWELDLPENHGMDGELLAAMHTALEGSQIASVVVVKDGVLVDEYYQGDHDETSVFRFNSCSKSISSALVGIAIDEGLIEGVDVPIAEFFPQLVDTSKEAITIRDVLEHRSGLEWYEFGGTAVSFWELNNADNWVDYVLERPLVAAPGSTFNYSTGGTHLLTAIVDQVAEGSVLDYAQSRLFGPLGMDSVHWRLDPQGLVDGGNGVEMASRDAAKFGQLFLDGGSWNGLQLVPEAWVRESTAIHVTRNGTSNGSYGYQWWIMPMAGYETFYALGAGGQFIVVVPALDLVAVITSEMPGGMPADTNVPYNYLSNYILAAHA